MHIVFLTDNFPPESNAPANRTFEHAIYWIKAGHKVTVVTCAPNFPGGRVFEGYKNRWYQRENMQGIDVVRVKTYMTANERFTRRVVDYLSFMIAGTIAASLQKKPDVFVATSPQFFCGLAGLLTATLRFRPFVLEIRDLWPDSIAALGVMKERAGYRFLEWLERLLYRRSDAIVVVTHAFKRIIAGRGGDNDKISVVLNGVEKDKFSPAEPDQELCRALKLENKFVVGYIGTHGLAHDLANVIKAAQALSDQPHIAFVFVGSGAEQQKIAELIEQYQLTNVQMLGQCPREQIPAYLRLCDLALIPLRNAKVFSTVIPSKLFECMGVGTPVLASLPEGEATKIVRETECGICVPPESPALLAEAISSIAANPGELERFKQNAIASSRLYSREHSAYNMLDFIELTVERASVPSQRKTAD